MSEPVHDLSAKEPVDMYGQRGVRWEQFACAALIASQSTSRAVLMADEMMDHYDKRMTARENFDREKRKIECSHG